MTDLPSGGDNPAPGSADTLDTWLARIERLHTRPIDMGLERVGAVARRLGVQLDGLVFMVAGTNGKGSTCHLLESICRAAGYRVGCYTSPHLLRFNERARIDGEEASDAQLIEAFEAVWSVRGDTPLTYFEFTTLAILRLFSQQALDVVVLEIGLGGRLDAVNLIDADCSIITAIDLDHADFLGNDREAIGWEKAHIMRAGRPAVIVDPQPPARLLEYGQALGAQMVRLGVDFNYQAQTPQQWSWSGVQQRRSSLAWPALRGRHQLINASGVLAALEAVRARLPVPQQAVRLGLAQVQIPGRFQVLPGRPTWVLDVAHNPHAAAQLARNLIDMPFHPTTWAVFGMLADKDVAGTVEPLREMVDHWIPCTLPGNRGLTATALAERLSMVGIQGTVNGLSRVLPAQSPTDGARIARERAGQDDRIIVFGSFLTVSGVLEASGAQRS